VSPHRAHRRIPVVLVVEDNPPDARLIHELLRAGPLPKTVHVVGSGDEAMSFLRRREPYPEAPRPQLVVLDLNLPGCDGRDVLSDIKNDPALRAIPVVILTTSVAPTDVQNAYELHANAYVVKPVGLDAFATLILAVEEFWLAKVQLPA
jgi:two-component system, chemotaxis family, response regulator Rcp1